MKRMWVVLFVSAVLLLTSRAEDKPAAIFTSGTTFVQVPVIVQKSGKHVSGLKKEDFVLRQDGKQQPIATFEEVHAGSPQKTEHPDHSGNPNQVPSQVTIVALDMINTPNLDRTYFNQEFERYLKRSEKFNGPVGVVAIERTGIRVIKGFTTEPAAVMTAVSQYSGPQAANTAAGTEITRALSDELISQSQTQLANGPDLLSVAQALKLREADEAMTRFQDRSQRIDTQLTIQQLAQALKGIPGRKSLLLVGSGFKFIDSNTVLKSISAGVGGTERNYSVDNAGETLNQAIYTWQVLNDANVAVYPIDTRRTVNSAFQTMDTSVADAPSDLTFRQNQQADQDVLTTFKTISAATGGKPCFYRTDLDNCVREAIDDDHDYYLLGFYADKNNRQPGWHRIEVKTAAKVNIRYRQGFMLAKFNPEEVRKTDIGLALSSPFAYTDLPFSGNFDSFADHGSQKVAKFRIQIPADSITVQVATGELDFDVVAIARAQGGKEAARFIQRIHRKFSPENISEIKRVGIDYGNQLELATGEYGIWFVVRDNLSGRIGSAVVPLKVP